MTGEEVRRLTFALRRPDTAAAAAEALRGVPGAAATEGLAELVLAPPSARAAVAAIAALEGREGPTVLHALQAALRSGNASVRSAAVLALRARGVVDGFERLLKADPSWPVRREALRALADAGETQRWQILLASDDPHWRVRHALIQTLLAWGDSEGQREEIIRRLGGQDLRTEGVRQYLLAHWSGRPPSDGEPPATPPAGPFWDDDPAVLVRNLRRAAEPVRRRALDVMPVLLGHDDERVRSVAVDALKRWGEPHHLAAALALLDEPRSEAVESLRTLLAALDLDRTEAVARLVLHRPDASPPALAWAIDQAGDVCPCEEERDTLLALLGRAGELPAEVRDALARLASRWPDAAGMVARVEAALPRAPELAASHPHSRAAALIPESAAELVRDPTRETSWHVLAAAARLAKVPLWKLEPDPPWRPETVPDAATEPISLSLPVLQDARVLGPAGLLVSPLGVSGHYGLRVEGFVRAVEAGVNLLFWEPNYHTQSAFAARLSAADRDALRFVAGTFEADGARVRKDAERALRTLRVERLAVFLVFWVRSWDRISDDVRDELERLKESGMVASYGLSTHSRPLAIEALAAGWNPVMVRHSAAHCGAEETVFPAARRTGAGVLTFNNTCYGRLLRPQGARPAPLAADCYRYTLAQPAVTACWTAPATLAELDENLAALHEPELPDDRRLALLECGEAVYREDGMFRRLVRSR
jgi:HEAT repeat protein